MADSPLSIVVVCNGCTDRTAQVAGTVPGVTVLETPRPSKAAALRLGDGAAEGFPRMYVDADVELDRAGVLALAAALDEPGVLAVAPARRLERIGMSLPVRWYYDVWESLPAVRDGLFGRGVVALSEAGHARIRSMPELMSDDLAMSSAFVPDERRVVGQATVVVHGPRTWADLVRRRVRAATGTRQAYEGPAGLRTDSRTTRADLLGMIVRRPSLAPKIVVFLAVAVIARRRAAQAVASGDYSTWLRDESSRQHPAGVTEDGPAG
jgi:hypothetical protein